MRMRQEERTTTMPRASNQAIKVRGDRCGSTEEDVARAIQGLKASMQTASQEKPVSVGGATQA